MSSASEAFVNVAPAVPRGRMIYRHTLLVRFTHWINADLLAVLLDERLADIQRPSRALLGQSQRV